MLNRILSKAPSQAGFTLIEVLLALAITSLIGTALTVAAIQVLSVGTGNNNHVTAVKQVENAAYWIGRDVQMAQTILPDAGSGFPLNISWKEWDGTNYQICYTIVNGDLARGYSVNGGTATQTIIARYIEGNASKTNCQYQNGVFTLEITANVTGYKPAIETRITRVIPNSAL